MPQDLIHVNKKFAVECETKKCKEEIARAEAAGELEESCSNSNDEGSDVEVPTNNLDLKIFDTLKAIGNKDPRIYDSKVDFFDDDDETKVQEKKRKPTRWLTPWETRCRTEMKRSQWSRTKTR
jgi:protein KRI1